MIPVVDGPAAGRQVHEALGLRWPWCTAFDGRTGILAWYVRIADTYVDSGEREVFYYRNGKIVWQKELSSD